MARINKIYLLLFILFYPVAVWSNQLDSIKNNKVTILYDPALQKAAAHIAQIFPNIKLNLENSIGWSLNIKPAIILIKDSHTFYKISANPFITAFARPEKQLIVMDYSRISKPLTLEITIKHELCHLLLHHHIKQNIPTWFDEGVAQWASDGFSELLISRKQDVLRAAALSEGLFSLNSLTTGFPKDKNSIILAYEESKSIVEYIVKRFGKKALLDILEYMKEGCEIETAIFRSVSILPGQLERDWHAHLRKTSTWLIWFIVHIYEILFFLAALTSVYCFFKLSIKKKQYTDDEDEFFEEHQNKD